MAIQLAGLVLIATTVGFSAMSVLLLRKTRKDGSVMEGLVQVVFLPEKRRRFVWLMSFEGSMFVLSGLLLGVFLFVDLPLAIGLAVFVVCFTSGLLFMTWRTLLGLRPSVLTDEQKEAVRREMPSLLPGLAFIPLGIGDSTGPDPQQLFVLAVPPRPGSRAIHGRSPSEGSESATSRPDPPTVG